MRFVVVNGRVPVRQNFCAHCWEPIGKGGYLRDIRTRLYYCEAKCYALKSGDAKIKPRLPEKAFGEARAF